MHCSKAQPVLHNFSFRYASSAERLLANSHLCTGLVWRTTRRSLHPSSRSTLSSPSFHPSPVFTTLQMYLPFPLHPAPCRAHWPSCTQQWRRSIHLKKWWMTLNICALKHSSTRLLHMQSCRQFQWHKKRV